ncbi:MAG: secretin N-terminal domain-containing protein [Candidatus Omnitrophica bacterium]|nr:secretin N-terminal domain-containing protein [Candidatus Omnitrophota bacterium]
MKNKSVMFFTVFFLLFSVWAFAAKETSDPDIINPSPQVNLSPQIQAATAQSKISLDLKGMDVVDVLKMLATRAAMNIVIGKNVSGKVTILLKDVDVKDAFEIVVLANDLACDTKGAIINVMTQRDYELLYGERYQDKKQAKIIQLKYAKAADISKALNQIKTNIGKVVIDEGSNTVVLVDAPEALKQMEDFLQKSDLPMETRVFSLDYAQAEKINTKLQETITKGVGSIKFDERTNKLVVRDYPEKLNEISKIVTAFDEKTPQVLIDAQLIEVDPSDKFEMGVNWDYWIKKYFEFRSALPINTASTLFLGTVQTGTPDAPGKYKAVMDVLRTIGDTKILSSPRIMVLNNQEAKIHVGKKEAYITSTTSQGGSGNTVTSQTVNFVDTGITLSVTPTINKEGFITIKIKPEVSEATSVDLLADGQKTSVPIVTSSDAETTVMVKDGVTVIMGGLAKDKKDKTVKKIPLLGDIPGVGFLFRSTSDNLTKTDLVILLTPHIMSGESSFSDFEQVKPKDGFIAKMVDGKIIKERYSRQDAQQQYYNLISSKVKALTLFNQPKDTKGSVEVLFTLAANGQIISGPQIVTSDNQALNETVIACIKDAAPFNPFPVDLKKAEETFRVTLDYK